MSRKGSFDMSSTAMGELESVLARGPEMQKFLMQIGEEVMAAAEREAEPLGHRHEGEGKGGPPYKEAFGVVLRPWGKVMAAIVYNTAYDAVWVELGAHPHGGSTPALGYHVLSKALAEVAGDNVSTKVTKGLNSQKRSHGVKPKAVGG